MGLRAEEVLAIANKHTDNVLGGIDTIEGKPCTIASITDITGGHRVTYRWTADDGSTKTKTMDVMDGSQGPQGVKGDTGNTGAQGPQGETGQAATIGIGSVTSGVTPSVTNGGTSQNAILNFVLPKGDKGDKGDKGEDGQNGSSFSIKSRFATEAELIAAFPDGPENEGDAYFVGTSTSPNLYVWLVDDHEWHNNGPIAGVKGDKGDQGDEGFSPVASVTKDQATGIVTITIRDKTSQTTATVTDGANGNDGSDGKSAYEVACDEGFVGTEAEWLASLVGEKGEDGENGANGTDGVSPTANVTKDGEVVTIHIEDASGTTEVVLDMSEMFNHNIPRRTPKDITAYVTDGSIWDRLNGTNGYTLYQDLYVGDYFQMSRAITAPNQDSQYATTGSDWVTIAGIDTRMGDGDGGDSVSVVNYHHLVMVPGKGFGGTQHFGRKRMNSSNVTTGGYVASEMHTATIGAVTASGSTASGATINQQLKAEFGDHLKTTRELLTKTVNATGYNKLGTNSGCSSDWAWTSCQAVLMSEVECYGATVFSSSGYDTGNACDQLPLFRNSKEARNNRSGYYWLKDVASAANFCDCLNGGHAGCDVASYAHIYVRPRFILAA